MRNASHIIRRTHLYLALFGLPWIVMYGVTAIAFTHAGWFEKPKDLYNSFSDAWTEEGSWECDVVIPPQGEISRSISAELVAIAGVEADAFGGYRSGSNEVSVYFPSFHELRRLTYRVAEKRLYLHRSEPPLQNTLSGMHGRAGYQHDGILNFVWALMVDVTSVGFVLWVLTGLYIWWQSPTIRLWGAAALIGGIVSFVAFLVLL